jgi:hypothetical protein
VSRGTPLRGDELGGAEIADEPARLDRAMHVDRDGGADDGDAGELETVPETPAEVRVAPEECGRQRCGQPRQSDDDAEVDTALCQEVGLEGEQHQDGVEEDADDERADRRCAGRCGD